MLPRSNQKSVIFSDKQNISAKFLCTKLRLHRTFTIYGNAFDFFFFKKFSVSDENIVLGKTADNANRMHHEEKHKKSVFCLALRQVQHRAHLQRLIICS